MRTGDAGGAVDEDEDHAAEGPRDAEDADAIAGIRGGLLLVADNRGDADIEEEEGTDKLSDERTVEGPEAELPHVDERGRGWVPVVLGMLALRLHNHLLRHSS